MQQNFNTIFHLQNNICTLTAHSTLKIQKVKFCTEKPVSNADNKISDIIHTIKHKSDSDLVW